MFAEGIFMGLYISPETNHTKGFVVQNPEMIKYIYTLGAVSGHF